MGYISVRNAHKEFMKDGEPLTILEDINLDIEKGEFICLFWNKDAAAIERLIRGLNSWPSAYTAFHDKTLKIWDADVEEESSDAQPGTVVKVTPDALYVQTGKNLLKLNEVQIQGKKRMTVKAFLLGHKVEIGTLLGQDNENNR